MVAQSEFLTGQEVRAKRFTFHEGRAEKIPDTRSRGGEMRKARNTHGRRRRTPKNTPEPGQRQLTPKQRALVQGVAEGKSLHRAALDAGYSPSVAKSDVYQNPRLRRAIAEVMDRMGLSEETLLQPIKDGLTANKRTRADHPIRLRASETGLRLRGYLGKESDAGASGPESISIVIEQAKQADGSTQAQRAIIRIGEDSPPRD